MSGMTDDLVALNDLLVGVEMDRHSLPDGEAKVAALGRAIARLRGEAQAEVIETPCIQCGMKVFAWPQHKDSSVCFECTADGEAQAVAWPSRMVNLPYPDGSHDRIVGFRVSEGDPILGSYGLSEPLAWLRSVTVDRQPVAPISDSEWVAHPQTIEAKRQWDEVASYLGADGDDPDSVIAAAMALHGVERPAAPTPVTGDAVAGLPEKWRAEAYPVTGTKAARLAECAEELESALAQDRASRAGAAGVEVSEAAIFRAADALCAKWKLYYPWNLHYPDAVSMAKTALTAAALRTGGGAS